MYRLKAALIFILWIVILVWFIYQLGATRANGAPSPQRLPTEVVIETRVPSVPFIGGYGLYLPYIEGGK